MDDDKDAWKKMFVTPRERVPAQLTYDEIYEHLMATSSTFREEPEKVRRTEVANMIELLAIKHLHFAQTLAQVEILWYKMYWTGRREGPNFNLWDNGVIYEEEIY